MRAAIYEEFRSPLTVKHVADPEPPADGVVLEVGATGVCRSDWHGWMGHDPDIRVPHVPGHEIAGIVAAAGKDVRRFAIGARVTLPFVCGCGRCPQCASGNQQICDNQSQPGFTHWGSYAEYVVVRYADQNLVALPEAMNFVTAASLGCRFGTAFRAVVAQGRVRPGQWVAVHGCGGVGLSVVMIAAACGARVVAIDVERDALSLAGELGAETQIDARAVGDVVEAVRDRTDGGVHLSVDGWGSAETSFNSIANLRKRGRHVQVGLMVGKERRAPVPMDRIIANELEVLGSHGLQAHRYAEMLGMIVAGRCDPARLIRRRLSLTQAADELGNERYRSSPGVAVIDRFGEEDA